MREGNRRLQEFMLLEGGLDGGLFLLNRVVVSNTNIDHFISLGHYV